MSSSLFSKNLSVISRNLASYFTQSCSSYLKRKVSPLYNCMPSVYLSSVSDSLRKEEKSPQTCQVTFIKKDGEKITVSGKQGDTLLDLVVDNNLDFGGFGACEGTLTCSTCHVILKKEDYDRLPTEPGDEESDMLDLAYELCDTSRLGCQIELTKELDGLEVKLPSTINDARK